MSTSRRASRLAIGLGCAALLLALLLLTVATLLPSLARGPGATLLAQTLHRPVHLDGLRLDPLHLSIHLDGLAIGEAARREVAGHGDLPFASVAHIDLSLAAASLGRGYPVVAGLTLDRPQIRVTRDTQGRLSVQDLLDRFLMTPSKGPPAALVLRKLLIKDGRIDWLDERTRHQHILSAVQFDLPEFSTRKQDAELPVEPHLYARLDDHLIVLFGTAHKAAAGEVLAAHFEVEDLRLPDYLDLVPMPAGVTLRDGRFDARLNLHVRLRPGSLPALQLDGRCALRAVDVRETSGSAQPLMSLAEMDLPVQAFDLDARALHLGQIAVNGFSAHVTRNRLGSIDWLHVLQGIEATRRQALTTAKPGHVSMAGTTGPVSEARSGTQDTPAVRNLIIDGIRFEHGQATWRDEALAEPLDLALKEARFTIGALHWPAADETPFSLDVQGDHQEQMNLSGTLSAPGPQVSAQVRFRHIDLDRLSPYFAGRLPVRLSTSPFDSGATVVAGLDADGAFARISELEFALPELRVSERVGGRLLVSAKALQIHALEADSRSGSVTAQRLQWSELHTGFEIGTGPSTLSGLTAAWHSGRYGVTGLDIAQLSLPAQGGAAILHAELLQADLPARQFSLGSLAAADLGTPTGLHAAAVRIGATQADLDTGKYHTDGMNAADLTAPGNNHFAGLVLTAADLDFPARHLTLGSLQGTELALGGRFNFPLLDAANADIDLTRQQIKVGSLNARGARLTLLRTAQGRLSTGTLLDILQAFPAQKPTGISKPSGSSPGNQASRPVTRDPSPQAGLAGWTAQLGLLDLEDWSGSFRDESLARPAELHWSALHLHLQNLSTQSSQAAQIDFRTTLNQQTQLALSGDSRLAPLDGHLTLRVVHLELPELLPWLPIKLPVDINTAQFDSAGTLRASGTLAAPALLWDGSLQLDRVALIEPGSAQTVLGWERFDASDVHINTRPLDAAIGAIKVQGLRAQLALEANGGLNFTRLMAAKDAGRGAGDGRAPPMHAPAAATTAMLPAPMRDRRVPFPLAIGRIDLSGSSLDFNDRFIHPEYSAHISDLQGVVSGLSSAAGPPGRIEMSGRLDGGGRLQVNGALSPLTQPLFLDLQTRVDNFDLGPLSSYSTRFTGFPIERGKLSLNLAYRIEQGRITARNQLTLDQLTLGPRRDIPGIRQLPMDLAVSLLRNSEGVIAVDLPIEGTLSDPQFNLGNVIGQLVTRAAERAVTAPFRWLGGLFEGEHAEQLDWIGFAPGSDTLDTVALSKLETLSRALKARPALRLDISARTDPDKDPDGLRAQLFDDTLRVQKIRRMILSGQPVGGPDSVQWSAEERPGLIRDAWQQAHPKTPPGNDPAMLEMALRASLRAGPDELADLARKRAQAAQDWLTGTGGLGAARIFVVTGAGAQGAAQDQPSAQATPTAPTSPLPAARIDFALH